MAVYYYILILFTVTACDAKIKINITTSSSYNKTKLNYSGIDLKQVTGKEIEIFNITNENLNRGVRIEMGKVPNNIFLKDPTKYGDIFKKFKWPEVRRKLIVTNITIFEFIKKELILKRHEHINNTTGSIQSKTDIVENVYNTVTSIWRAEGLPNDVIIYEVDIDFDYGKLNYEAKWRDDSLKMVQLPIGKSKGVIEIKSGQSVVTELSAEKIILLLELEYKATLVGNIVADYDPLFGKYHFYSPAIENIMNAAKLKNEIITKQLMEIRLYSNPRLKVYDKDSGKEIRADMKKHQKRRKNKPNII